MLPNILDVATRFGLVQSEPTKDGQVRVSCPTRQGNEDTCLLNPVKNVFYCKCCKKGGGVLKFECLLSGLNIQEVRSQYFKSPKKRYGAATLTTQQLRMIGWEHLKTSDKTFYGKHHKQIWEEWLIYRNERLEKLYALFLIMVHTKDKVQGSQIYEYVCDAINASYISNLSIHVFIDAFVGEIKSEWVEKGTIIARDAFKRCSQFDDYQYRMAALLVIFDFHTCTVETKPTVYVPYYSSKKLKYIPECFDWEMYKYNMLVLTFAMFTVMLHMEDELLKIKAYERILKIQKMSLLDIFDTLVYIDEYIKEDFHQADWAREGTRLARLVWLKAENNPKHEYVLSLFLHVKFLQPNIKKAKEKGAKAI
ncbi:hypothetical protein ACMGD3_24410 [Lysinibacillus sphaericus]|uniref:hypothetical protein n=1 Tax=Lysinibacillus sphaericus TaxID=1421 RepID=UPI003F7AA297